MRLRCAQPRSRRSRIWRSENLMRITEYGVRNSTRGIKTFCEFGHMCKGLLYIIMTLTVIFATAVQAQEGAAENDPFHPSAGRPVAIVPGPPSGDGSWGRDPFNNPLAGKPPAQKMAPSPGLRPSADRNYFQRGRSAGHYRRRDVSGRRQGRRQEAGGYPQAERGAHERRRRKRRSVPRRFYHEQVRKRVYRVC